MSCKRKGKQTVEFAAPPSIIASAGVAGKKEGEGPLAKSFDHISEDPYFGERSWEKAESAMQRLAFTHALNKAGLSPSSIQYIFAGDLLNQCIASVFAMRDSGVPYLGLYGACSTIAEGLALAAMSIDGGFADVVCAMTSSHFCSAERQFRMPLEYGGQRSPTAQWTATAAGCAVLSSEGGGPYITHATVGTIRDAGICDADNMGAAMARAAYDTLSAHFRDLGIEPGYYDLIVTGDLGSVGRSIVIDFFRQDGADISPVYDDCGMLLYSNEEQDVHAGGSGCGCSALVLCTYLLDALRSGRCSRLLFAATGALMSPVSSCQGESIPGICHAVAISNTKDF
ncbi:MAG: stage V sporulation protein AD [Oscillospiraceae bacterium]|nr:stage V sporulation protein AD [Oscillospiraceae bacterium]